MGEWRLGAGYREEVSGVRRAGQRDIIGSTLCITLKIERSMVEIERAGSNPFPPARSPTASPRTGQSSPRA